MKVYGGEIALRKALMNWTVYWLMFPVCIVIASIAMLSGISRAAILSPGLMALSVNPDVRVCSANHPKAR